MLNDRFSEFDMKMLEMIINQATMDVAQHVADVVINAIEDAAKDSSELTARKSQIYRSIIKGLSEQIDKIEGIHVE